jgi:ABC-2 type transport system ATP-binding protein/lipopolysaccharide transport system ATP-binding protein
MNLPTVSEAINKMIEDQPPHPEDVVHLENVSVLYRVPTERIGTFKEYMIRSLKRQVRMRTFWAVNDISLNIHWGEVFGFIGDNGAGKSTLLKVVARVLRPTKGRVIVRGKLAPLLELGAGFHPELTGKENIFLNGTLLGYSYDEMQEKYQQIVDFSELGGFIDAPIRTYSTGMYARLGFSVATAHEPDVLIVDEVLGVGDETFQHKCAERIAQFRQQGTSILLVSHSMALIESMCQRAAWLDHGKLMAVGKPDQVIQAYREKDRQ